MNRIYAYELWNGKEVVGHYVSMSPLYGRTLAVPELPPLKQSYFRKIKRIEVPIITRVVSDDGVTMTVRIVLDVSKKSKRQIELLKGFR